MIHKKFTATIFVLFCVLFQTEAQAPADIVSVLDSISTQDVPANAPGVAVAVINKGEVVFQRCAGYANLADTSLITLDTRFNLASNGKQFTALAILLLQHQGKLTLNDDLRKFLPQLFKRVQSRITIRNLLTHTSGIRDVYDLLSLQGITWWQKTM
jgi:CubicO group peptidase (beta-lactamase class C family)